MRLALALPLLALACSSPLPSDLEPSTPADDESGTDYEAFQPDSKADGVTKLGGPVAFSAACSPGDHLTIAAVGDVLLHGNLQVQGYAAQDGFASLWGEVGDLLAQADLTYANLEGPAATGLTASLRDVRDPGKVFDNVVHTGYPRFNYHPSIAGDLVAAGVDVVSTANNHAMDRGALGAERTLEALDEAGLPHTGTLARDGSGDLYALTAASGFQIAWIACTFSTNQIPDTRHQVLGCYTDTAKLERLVRELAGREGVDAVIVTPHWGVEYTANPRAQEVRLSHRLLDAGATLLLGGHPHVLQPWEKHVTPDGRETFAIYSLGNFVSGQRDLPRRSTLMLYVGLVRGADGHTRVEGVRYVPLHMTAVGTELHLQAVDRAADLGTSRALTVKMFGSGNLQDPDAALSIAGCE